MIQLDTHELHGSPRPVQANYDRSVRMSDSEPDFACITDKAGVQSLKDEWNTLFAEAGRPHQVFQTFGWCRLWCDHYLAPGHGAPTLALVTARISGRLVLVLPLVVERHAGVRVLGWLGEPVSQYGDVLAAHEAADVETLALAWAFAGNATRADVANLRKVRADAVVAPLLDRLGAVVTATQEAPFLDLRHDKTFEGWEKRRDPRARKNRKRQARRLAEVGKATFVCHSRTPEAGASAGLAARMKHRALTAKGALSPALADPRFEAFFAAAAADRSGASGAIVHAIVAGGQPAALKVLVEAKTTACLHIAVFDPAFEKYGAGAVLLEHVIAESIDSGKHTLDLLAPRHSYKMDFADGVVLVNDRALPLTAKGWVYARAYLGIRSRVKAAVESLPLALRRIAARLT